jgi:hypothetical protein
VGGRVGIGTYGESVAQEPDPKSYELAATERCIRRDLDLLAEAVAEEPEMQGERHPLLKAFYSRRAQSPVGQETIEGLQANIVAYSLHAGRWRGLTWHDEDLAIVWLLAGHYHRSGERDDSYPHFRGLAKHQLLPTEEDYERVFDREAHAFAQTVVDDVAAIAEQARAQPGEIVSGRVASRIAVRAVEQDGSLQVAVKMQLYPGDEQVPAEWLMTVLAAFFPDAPFEDFLWGRELAGARAASDEYVFSQPPRDRRGTGRGTN